MSTAYVMQRQGVLPSLHATVRHRHLRTNQLTQCIDLQSHMSGIHTCVSVTSQRMTTPVHRFTVKAILFVHLCHYPNEVSLPLVTRCRPPDPPSDWHLETHLPAFFRTTCQNFSPHPSSSHTVFRLLTACHTSSPCLQILSHQQKLSSS